MKKFSLLYFPAAVISILLFACGQGTKSQQESSSELVPDSIQVSLSQVWATDTIPLVTPECASYDADEDVFYVSNLNRENDVEDDGYISMVNADGSIKNAKWVEGVGAPLGNDFYDGHLYVNDKSTVIKIDIETGKIVEKIQVEGAKRLNGIDIDGEGNIYSADIDGNKIIKITPEGEVSIVIESEALNKPNGVIVEDGNLLIASSGGGKLLSVSLETNEMTTLGEGIERADGIVPLGDGQYLVSSWTGLIHFVSEDGTRQILDTKDQGINAADITYIPKKDLLVIPTFNDNRLVAYKLNIP